MDRMNIKLLFTGLMLFGWLFTSSIRADESYVPNYSATPSATVKPTPQPTITSSVVPGSCTIKAVKAAAPHYPTSVSFTANSRVKGQVVGQFAYDFGDGNVATGSTTVTHQYVQPGTYPVVADPILDSGMKTNPCKISIVLKGEVVATPTPSPLAVVATPLPATTAAVITQQPETGPSSVYWMSLGSLVIIWLGAEWWYRRQHLPIG